MRLSTGGRARCRPSRRRSGRTPGGILLRIVVVYVLAMTLTGCEVIGGLLPDELRGSRSVPDEQMPAVAKADTPAPAEDLRVGRSLGDPEAPVRIDVFEDPQCPACAAYTARIEPLLIAGPVSDGQVFLTYKDFPFLGPESLDAAVAMRVAEAMDGKFWDYHSLIFHNRHGENQGAFSLDRLTDMAELVGLDRAAFLAEMWDPTVYQEAVEAEAAEAAALGIDAVPSLVVNGEIMSGVPEWDALSAAIEAAASDAG